MFERMGRDGISKLILQVNVEGKRRIRKPREQWKRRIRIMISKDLLVEESEDREL